MTASDPQRVNEEVEEVEEGEENGEVYTGKALVTGTDDTTNFNASLDLDPRPIHLLTGGLGGSANSLESSEADTSSFRMEVKAAVEVKTRDRHPRPLARSRKTLGEAGTTEVCPEGRPEVGRHAQERDGRAE